MLTITIPGAELWNEAKQEFIVGKDATIVLEHSLVSLSKWESKWKKPFLTNDSKTSEEIRDYIRCMTITQNVDPNVYFRLTEDNVKEIEAYIQDSMTATRFTERPGGKRGSGRIITSEVIYAWMTQFQIPFECQKWHLNRLLTLIRACNEMSQPPKKMSKNDIYRQNSALNAARHKQHHK